MAELIVRTPVKDYNGVSAGVAFSDGVAVVDESQVSALRYFRGAGYQVSSAEPVPTPTVLSRAVGVERPPRNAPKGQWVEWAVDQVGEVARVEVESMSKAELVKTFGQTEAPS